MADNKPTLRDGIDALFGAGGLRLSGDRLERLLNLRYGGGAGRQIAALVGKPMADLIGRRGKRVRGRLVEVGARLAGRPAANDACCVRLMEAIEALHAGSLAIDDLQDGSRMRRGAPSLHVKYGVPIAINVGNLLYFWPGEAVASLGLPAETENRLHRIYHRTMVRAHLGQVMDVGVPIDTIPQADVNDLCLAAMELKSGALFAMSLLFGAVWAGGDEKLESAIDAFGHGFGIGLQMFDDIGNVRGAAEPVKRWEDLLLRRPTWVWACAARHFSPDVYAGFVSAVHQLSAGDRLPLETWFAQHDFMGKATRLAHEHVDRCFRTLEAHLAGRAPEPLGELRALAAEIARAYE